MGQSSSKSRPRSPPLPRSNYVNPDVVATGDDYTLNLPDECLASILQLLSAGDRNRSSLVCHRWLKIDGESRQRLSLNAQAELAAAVPQLFSRFDGVTKLTLKCERRSVSIADDSLILISQSCRNLTRLKLRACRELTDAGIAAFAANCTKLQKFSCGSCNFGAKGMNAILQDCAFLEELSVKRLRGIADEPIAPGKAAVALKMICLKDLHSGQSFEPLISAAKNLQILKLIRCSGDWDNLLQICALKIEGLVELHLERLQVSDLGLSAISNCLNLETLHLAKTPECTNLGLISLAENCKLIRKVHIDGWRTNRISDDGLIAIATHCFNLQELVLIGVNPTSFSLEKLATNCQNLERLALCGSETVGDAEMLCIAAKCNALKKLCIKSCPVSNQGVEALAGGCPNLVKVKVKKCRGVTFEVVDRLRASRDSIAVNLDATEYEMTGASVAGLGNGGVDVEPIRGRIPSNTRRALSFRMGLRSISGRRLFSGTFGRCTSIGGRFLSNQRRRRTNAAV